MKAQVLKGFRDILPADMAIRQKVIATLKQVFESYGFEPLETPALEYAETLLGKYGEDADRLVYTFPDKGDRMVGLRYDLTVPVSRVLAQYSNQITLPFKRYQIQDVWRADKPQKGRYRQFTQCDIDLFGSTSPIADAEIISLIYDSLLALGFKQFIIKINSRQSLFALIESLGIKDQNKQLSVLRTLDKLDKIGQSAVEEELAKKDIPLTEISQLFTLIDKSVPDENLKQLFNYLKSMNINSNYYSYSPTLMRGLDYYTGPIFETVIEKPTIGSITGGGRYDKLISQLGGPDIPATGTTIGLDRICDVIKDQHLWPELPLTPTKVLVTVFSSKYLTDSIQTVQLLRNSGINAELYLDDQARLDKQIKYADKKSIPLVIILGPDEIAKNKVMVKDLKTKQQHLSTIKQLLEDLS